MAAQFAGSRSLDERRRRRLATESDEAVPEAVTASPPPRRASAARNSGRQRGPSHFPLRKAISARVWKHAGLALLGLLAAAGVLAGGWSAGTHAARFGPGFAQLFDLSEARLVRWYVASAIFLASQLALLIWWLRSQSLQDFNGRYRGWAICAILGFLAALAVQTDACGAWSDTVGWLWPTSVPNMRKLSWMFPVLFCGLCAWRFLHGEMRDCRTSLMLLWLAASLGGALAAIAICGPLPLSVLSARLVECGMAMLAAQCLCLSFLFHARHAIYVSVEPPANRPAWFVALWKLYRSGGKGRRSQKSATGSSDRAVASSRSRRKKRSVRPTRSTGTPMKEHETPIKEAASRSNHSATPVVSHASHAKPTPRADQRQMRRSA